jgi:hypothetical protein
MFAAPLYANPTTDMEIRVNDLRLKYRTYMVEMDVDYVSCLFVCSLLIFLILGFFLSLCPSKLWCCFV